MKPATRSVTVSTGKGKHMELWCEDCYREQQQKELTFIHGVKGGYSAPVEIAQENICRRCGTTSSDFSRTGILGCENCYNDLAPEVLAMIKTSQVKTLHMGKSPLSKETKSSTVAQDIESVDVKSEEPKEENEVLELKKQLESAILTEDFEQACVLRDKLNALESERDEDA